MGVLRFTAANLDRIRFQTLAAALGNTSDGAWTCAVLLKQASIGAFHAQAYLCNSTPTTKAGWSINGSNQMVADVAAYGGVGTTALDDTAETYIAVATKQAGTAAVSYHVYKRSTTTWASVTAGSNLADQTASSMLELGTFEGGGDLANGWIGLVGFWEGQMSQANAETLDNNWRTSDWWSNAHGQPTALIECNVAAASLVDLAGNATNIAVTGTPAVDAGETLSSWNFDSTGALPPVVAWYVG